MHEFREWRKRNKITLKQASSLCLVGFQWLAKVEAGKAEPSPLLADKMKQVMKTSKEQGPHK